MTFVVTTLFGMTRGSNTENGSIQHDIEDRIAAGAGTGNGSTIPEEHQESALVLIEEYSVRAGEDLDSQAIEDLRATDDLIVETPVIEDDRIIQHVNHLLTEDRVVKNVDDLGTNLIELRSMDLLSSMEGSGSLLLDDSPFITRSEAEQSFPKEPQPALIEESRNDDKNELKFPFLLGVKKMLIWHFKVVESTKFVNIKQLMDNSLSN